jgi:hypothetical protein
MAAIARVDPFRSPFDRLRATGSSQSARGELVEPRARRAVV